MKAELTEVLHVRGGKLVDAVMQQRQRDTRVEDSAAWEIPLASEL